MAVFNAAGLPVQLLPILDRNFSDLAATIKPGQSLRGRVTEVFPDGRAIVNFRGIPVTAELRGVALEKGEVIQVAVRDLQGTPTFQLLRGTPAGVYVPDAGIAAAGVGGAPAAGIPAGLDPVTVSRLADLGLPTDGFHASILELMQDYGVPVSRESVVAVKEMVARLVSLLGEAVPAAQTAPAPGTPVTAAAVPESPVSLSPSAAPPSAAPPSAAPPPLAQPIATPPTAVPASPALSAMAQQQSSVTAPVFTPSVSRPVVQARTVLPQTAPLEAPGVAMANPAPAVTARPANAGPDIIRAPASEGAAAPVTPWPGVSSPAVTEITSSLSEAYIAARLGLSPAARQAGATVPAGNAEPADLPVAPSPAAMQPARPQSAQGPSPAGGVNAVPEPAPVVVGPPLAPVPLEPGTAGPMTGARPAAPGPLPAPAQVPLQPAIRWINEGVQQATATQPAPAAPPASPLPGGPARSTGTPAAAAPRTESPGIAFTLSPTPSSRPEGNVPAPAVPIQERAPMPVPARVPIEVPVVQPAPRALAAPGMAVADEPAVAVGTAGPAPLPALPGFRPVPGPVLTAARNAFPSAMGGFVAARETGAGPIAPQPAGDGPAPSPVRQVLARAAETMDAVSQVLPPRTPALARLVTAARELADTAAEVAAPSRAGIPPSPAMLQSAANRASAVLDGIRNVMASSASLPPAEFPVLKGVAELAGLATGIIHEAATASATRASSAPRAVPPSAGAGNSVMPSTGPASMSTPVTGGTAAPETAAPQTTAPETAAPQTAAPETAASRVSAVPFAAAQPTVAEAGQSGIIDVPRIVAALVAGLKAPVRAVVPPAAVEARPVQAEPARAARPEAAPSTARGDAQSGSLRTAGIAPQPPLPVRIDAGSTQVRAAGTAPEPPMPQASAVPAQSPVSTQEVAAVMRGTPLVITGRAGSAGDVSGEARTGAPSASAGAQVPQAVDRTAATTGPARPVVSPLSALGVAEEPAGAPARGTGVSPSGTAATPARQSASLSPRLIETAVFMHGNALPARPEMARAAQEFLFGEPRLSQALTGFESAARSLDGAKLPASLRTALDAAMKTVDRLRVSPEDGRLADRLKAAVEEMGLSHEAVLNRMAGGEKTADRHATPAAIREARNSLKAAMLEVQKQAAGALAANPAPESREPLSRLAETVRDVVQVVQAQQLGGVARTGPESVVYVQIPLVPGAEFRAGEVHVSWRREKQGKKRDSRTPADMTMKVETRALGPVGVSMRLLGQSLSLIFRVFDEEIQDFITKELPDLVSRLTGFKFKVDRAVCEVDEVPEPEPAGRAVPPTSSLDLKA